VDLRALRVVVAIAEHGNLTSAAGSMHLSSSAVSHTLLGLEAELGIDLFARLPRGMALTAAGKAFLVAARRTLHDAEVTRRSVDEIRGLLAGDLNVGTVLGCTVIAAELIGEFNCRYPQVLVRLFPPASPDEVVERVRSGAC
jgi:LysR family transcriptional regulator, carnitine catabolism transcriptional activator